MTTETEELTNRIFDALDEAYDELHGNAWCGIEGKQTMYDVFGEKLDEILNSKK